MPMLLSMPPLVMEADSSPVQASSSPAHPQNARSGR